MNKFKLKTFRPHMSFYLSRRVGAHGAEYLHSDGEVLAVREFWPTEKQARAVLYKFQPPLPLRVWVHGDVFQNCVGTWIYLIWNDEPHVLDLNMSQAEGTLEVQLRGDDVKFLFNIKDALSDRGLA